MTTTADYVELAALAVALVASLVVAYLVIRDQRNTNAFIDAHMPPEPVIEEHRKTCDWCREHGL